MSKTKVGKKKELTQQELKENLDYDPITGIFTRTLSKSGRVKIGDNPGYYREDGYLVISVNGHEYRAHRLEWLYMTGKMPKKLIDNKNGNPSDNWFDNLREATSQQNCQNLTKPRTCNKSGFLGVSLKGINKFYATITVSGRQKFLGQFLTPEEAHQAYLTAKRRLHEFCTI